MKLASLRIALIASTIPAVAVAQQFGPMPNAGPPPSTRRIAGQSSPHLSPLTLWYRSPAPLWTDALAIGNGRLGAMIFGGPEHDRMQLNDITVWSGGLCRRPTGPGPINRSPQFVTRSTTANTPSPPDF